jgi:ribonuclease P protein component
LLPRGKRLSKEREIKDVLGCRDYEIKAPLLYFVGRENHLAFSRFCVVTSRKLGKAIIRNRLRRLFSAALFEICGSKAKKSVDLVVYPRVLAIGKELCEIKLGLAKALVAVGIS